jgi:hypothetical protein
MYMYSKAAAAFNPIWPAWCDTTIMHTTAVCNAEHGYGCGWLSTVLYAGSHGREGLCCSLHGPAVT